MAFLIPFQITKVSTLADGSYSIVLNTPELDDQKGAQLLGMRRRQGIASLSLSDIPSDLSAEMDKAVHELGYVGKSPSERLRNALYAQWKNSSGVKTFDMFYNAEMEGFIESVKSKINKNTF